MSKSPLKARPLRNPGDSLDRQIERCVGETLTGFFLVAAMLTLLACMEWLGYLRHSPRQPVLYSVFAGIALGALGYKFLSLRKHVKNLRLGRDGERCVGQFIERLRESGALIFHDVPAEGFNLDHVVISAHGIYVIETKTHSKPYPDARVVAKGDELLVAGKKLDRDPIAQAKAAARWLENTLKESTGKKFSARPVVVFPGWFVEQVGPRENVWVTEPKMLPALIAQAEARMALSDVKLAAFHLSRYIRAEVDKAA